jgi:hypothetical protein
MSKPLKFIVSGERRAPIRDGSRDRGDLPGVDLVLKGWTVGLNKVQLTKALHAAGIALGEASKLTGQILDGRPVRVHVDQFPTVDAARLELTHIGIAELRG